MIGRDQASLRKMTAHKPSVSSVSTKVDSQGHGMQGAQLENQYQTNNPYQRRGKKQRVNDTRKDYKNAGNKMSDQVPSAQISLQELHHNKIEN